MKRLFLSILILAPLLALCQSPKREFRGAWMHTIGQSQYASQSSGECQEYLRGQLDRLQAAGVNAVLFQVRPSADAFYPSELEPWSKYLTKGGKAPEPYWDPLQFMIDEAHARGMELHAWLNPYRVTTSKNETLAPGHIYHKHPERFVKYAGDGKIYFDPALPENREFIAAVVLDIVNRYDVDGIHFDDYFYPYPAGGKDFPDAKSYAKYGNGMDKGDWRRQNVDQLIELVHGTIRESDRPWTRFGISPFGIWRNKASDPDGSDTNGLQNYDDLYADVLLWAENGWIDYLIPQLYWELEHPKASSLKLADWWAQAVTPECHLYIGQDVEKTMSKPGIAPFEEPNQLRHKIEITRSNPAILGNCWWPAYSITKDSQGVATALAEDFQCSIALPPEYPQLSSGDLQPVKKLRINGNKLSWDAAEGAARYVVYNFPEWEMADLDDASCIVAVTPLTSIEVEDEGVYVVTALDHANMESDPSNVVHKK